MYSKNTLNSGMSPPTRINLPPMNSTHSLHPPPPPPFQHEEEFSRNTTATATIATTTTTTTPYYSYKLPALHESSSSIYTYPSTSSASTSTSTSTSFYYAQQQHQTYSVEHLTPPPPPPPPTHSASVSSPSSSPHSRKHFPPTQPPPPPASFSRHTASASNSYQRQETYYPIYKPQEAGVLTVEEKEEEEEEEEEEEYIEEGSKMKRKKEMTERMKEIDREFTDNKEVLYREKLKRLREELSAMEQGQHKEFDESIADLEEKRKEMIQDAKLIMIYQISSVDRLCHLNYQLVKEESLAEQRELQNAMFSIIEEKRKRLKEYKDGELDTLTSGHQTRNKKRLLRKRGESETPFSKTSKRKPDRSKDNLGHLINTLSMKDEEDIEADFEAMTANIAKYNHNHNNKKIK